MLDLQTMLVPCADRYRLQIRRVPARQDTCSADRCRWPLPGDFDQRIQALVLEVPRRQPRKTPRARSLPGGLPEASPQRTRRRPPYPACNRARTRPSVGRSRNWRPSFLRPTQAFDPLLSFLKQQPIARANPRCCLGANEIYARLKGTKADLATLANDPTDYKALIVQAKSTTKKVALTQKLATRRLASGVVPELDACYSALELKT